MEYREFLYDELIGLRQMRMFMLQNRRDLDQFFKRNNLSIDPPFGPVRAADTPLHFTFYDLLEKHSSSCTRNND